MRTVAAVGWVALCLVIGRSRYACRLGLHDWQIDEYPEVMYPGVSCFAGTKHCRRCGRFSYWAAADENAWLVKHRPGLW